MSENKNMSDTPRTDAHIGSNVTAVGHAIVCHDFARTLERELNDWRTCADKLADALAMDIGHGRDCPCNVCVEGKLAMKHYNEMKP